MANKEPAKADVLQGTLDLMVLQTLLTLGPLHGYAIAARLEQVSTGALRLNMGTLYPGLMRLEQRGLVRAEWGVTDNNRKARFYAITAAGTAPARHQESGVGSHRVDHAQAPARAGVSRRRSPMSTLREWVSRLWGTLRRNRTDRDLEEELRLHLELAAEDARRRAGSPEDRGTRRNDSGRRRRASHGGAARPARPAVAPGSGVATCATAAACSRRIPGSRSSPSSRSRLASARTRAVFSFADTLLLRPLTVPRPGEVLTVGSTSASTIRPILLASYRDYVDVRDRSQSFEGLVAFSDAVVGFATEPDTLPRLTIGMLVTGNFFPVMGVEPALGRAFRPDEDQVPGRDAVVMLGHDVLAAGVRRRSLHPRPHDPAQRDRIHRHRRHARRGSRAWINTSATSSTRP